MFCLQEYNSPEEYIKDVQRYIRWSRAKVVATRELSDHINDQYDALRENGLNQKEAMRKAIEEMGDADVVGTELDIVHRPKVNWLLLLIAGVLLLSGILISAMLTSISLTVPKIIGIVLGVCVAAFLYFIDYTVLIRFPRALYGLLSLAAIFGLLYELWNGFAPLGYGFLFYLLLCYPIVLVGILFYEKNSESETKIIHYWLYAIFPLTLALINQAFPVFVLLLACELFIFCCGLKLKWLKWNRVNIFGVACMLIFLIIGVYLLSRFYHLFRLQENTAEQIGQPAALADRTANLVVYLGLFDFQYFSLLNPRYKCHVRCPVPFLPCSVVGCNLFGFGIVLAYFLCRQVHAVFIKYL